MILLDNTVLSNFALVGELRLLELIRTGSISLERGNEVLRGFIRFGYFSPMDRLDGLL